MQFTWHFLIFFARINLSTQRAYKRKGPSKYYVKFISSFQFNIFEILSFYSSIKFLFYPFFIFIWFSDLEADQLVTNFIIETIIEQVKMRKKILNKSCFTKTALIPFFFFSCSLFLRKNWLKT